MQPLRHLGRGGGDLFFFQTSRYQQLVTTTNSRARWKPWWVHPNSDLPQFTTSKIIATLSNFSGFKSQVHCNQTAKKSNSSQSITSEPHFRSNGQKSTSRAYGSLNSCTSSALCSSPPAYKRRLHNKRTNESIKQKTKHGRREIVSKGILIRFTWYLVSQQNITGRFHPFPSLLPHVCSPPPTYAFASPPHFTSSAHVELTKLLEAKNSRSIAFHPLYSLKRSTTRRRKCHNFMLTHMEAEHTIKWSLDFCKYAVQKRSTQLRNEVSDSDVEVSV